MSAYMYVMCRGAGEPQLGASKPTAAAAAACSVRSFPGQCPVRTPTASQPQASALASFRALILASMVAFIRAFLAACESAAGLATIKGVLWGRGSRWGAAPPSGLPCGSLCSSPTRPWTRWRRGRGWRPSRQWTRPTPGRDPPKAQEGTVRSMRRGARRSGGEGSS